MQHIHASNVLHIWCKANQLIHIDHVIDERFSVCQRVCYFHVACDISGVKGIKRIHYSYFLLSTVTGVPGASRCCDYEKTHLGQLPSP